MSNIIKIALSLIAGVLLFTSFVYVASEPAIASDYVANFERVPLIDKRPPQVATWELTPTVIVCEYAPVSEAQIHTAVRFWKDLGHRFFKTQYKHDPLNKCRNPNPKGYIVIHLVTMGVKMDESALAQTHFFVNNDTNKIEWAIIYMRQDIRDTVLEHELGHALGFLHFNKINHLMNEKWTMGGWDKEGLANKRQ